MMALMVDAIKDRGLTYLRLNVCISCVRDTDGCGAVGPPHAVQIIIKCMSAVRNVQESCPSCTWAP